MQEYKILWEERKVQIFPEFLSKMQYLTRGQKMYTEDKYIPGQDMKIGLFYDMIEKITEKSFSNIKFLPDSNNKINYDISLMQKLEARFKEIFPNLTDYHQIAYNIREIYKIIKRTNLLVES